MFVATKSTVLTAVAGLCFCIGLLSVVLSCPLKFISLVGKLVQKGFSIGLMFLYVGCIIGALIGLVVGLILVLYLPAVITIPYYFKTLNAPAETISQENIEQRKGRKL